MIDTLQNQMDFTPWMNRLKKVFKSMDDRYDRVAAHYGFNCKGCEDNCCLTRFYHHTLLEYLYLKEGLKTLDNSSVEAAEHRARSVVTETNQADACGEIPRIMCPLNVDGLCLVYDYRPMVCRLHGMAHELKKPGQDPVISSGCDLFTELTDSMEYVPFDRTPLYMDLARLEGELRNAAGFNQKIRHTIAEMILL